MLEQASNCGNVPDNFLVVAVIAVQIDEVVGHGVAVPEPPLRFGERSRQLLSARFCRDLRQIQACFDDALDSRSIVDGVELGKRPFRPPASPEPDNTDSIADFLVFEVRGSDVGQGANSQDVQRPRIFRERPLDDEPARRRGVGRLRVWHCCVGAHAKRYPAAHAHEVQDASGLIIRFIDRGFGDAVLGGADAFDLETRFHQRVGYEELVVHFVEGIRVEKHPDP